MLRFERIKHCYGPRGAQAASHGPGGATPERSLSGQSVSEIDLELERAETTVLIGPSGCGKSTLLKLAAGLLFPERGRVVFDGVEVTPATATDCRRRLGYVIQSGGLFPHLTALANVTLMARHLRREDAWIDTRVRELCALVRLPEALLQRFPSQLSGGQRQRVSLMRALLLDPEMLLLDEPLGALDPMVRFEMQSELAELFAQLRKTVLLVTHDLAEAAHFGHTLVLLRDGAIVQRGTLDSLAHTPAEPFVTDFLNAQRALVLSPELGA